MRRSISEEPIFYAKMIEREEGFTVGAELSLLRRYRLGYMVSRIFIRLL